MTTTAIEDIYELSPLQQGMLLHTLFGAGGSMYVAQRSYRIRGRLDATKLREAWQHVVARHTALRTSFHWDELDKPLQVVHGDLPVLLLTDDWSGLPEDIHEQRFAQVLADEREVGFDLARPPLMRLRLVRLNDDHHRFVWTHHMIVLDGWSVPIVTDEVIQQYRTLTTGTPAALPEAPPYSRYIEWIGRQDMAAAQDFWRAELDGISGPTEIGPANPRQPIDRLVDVGEHVCALPEHVVDGLQALAGRQQVTLNTIIQAGWAIVLHHFSGSDEVVFGVTSAGRPGELADIDAMVGSFISTLPVRVQIGDGEAGPWLRDLQRRQALVRRYEYAPLSRIKQWAGVSGTEPIFESLIAFDNYPVSIEMGDLSERFSFGSESFFEKTSEPLTLMVTLLPDLSFRLLYHQHRFSAATISEIMRHFAAILNDFAADPDGRTPLPKIGRLASGGVGGYGGGLASGIAIDGLWDLLGGSGWRDEYETAVVSGEGVLSYRELSAAASRVARLVRNARAGVGSVVGVCAERSPELVAGLLGVVKAGAAFLPLDPSLPSARVGFMVADARAGVVLAQHRFAPLVPAGTTVVWLDGVADGAEDAGTADPDADSDAITASGGDAAYVMYTSGSTGRPKGVVISHAAICNRLAWMQEAFRLAAGERVLQKTPVGFDVSVWEFFWPLMAGAVVVLARPGGHQDARYLVRSMREQQVSVAHFVPSMLKLFLEEPGAGELPALKRVVCSGEALSASLAARCKAALPGAGLFNLYGPTEAAVDVTWWDCRQQAPQGVVPIGRPVANTRVLVLDRWLAAVPDGVPGELYLGGVQLARGYAGRPGLTAERFVASPFGPAGQRLLRTGDRARVLPGGVVEFLGRADGQVKLRGYRIELGEVEQVLAAHDWVREAAAVVRDGPAGPQLAAYLTGRAGCRLDLDEVRGHLKARLPSYMIPAHLIILDALPLTPNGKTNRNALPPPPETTSAATRIRPRTPREEAVTRVFCDVLGLAEVSVTTSFFDLGGDSFSAVRAIRRIEGASVAALAANPTARGLAEALDAEDSQRVLVRLNAADPRPRRTLVCVPFGGGNALNYVPLARVIPSQIALLAVSLPGHDVGSDEPLRPLDEVADTCVEQILREAQGAVSVYGHCIGVALATEIVRRLEAAGMGVDRLFLAGSYPFYAGSLAARITGLLGNRGADADQRKIRYLQSLGGFRDVADPREVEFVMRNFNHDDLCARQYFSRQWSGKRLVRLQAPITFIAGAEDPETRNYKRRFRTWCKFSGSVDLAVVPGGGHYFLGERAEIVSRIIQRALAINDEQRTHTASRLGAERA